LSRVQLKEAEQIGHPEPYSNPDPADPGNHATMSMVVLRVGSAALANTRRQQAVDHQPRRKAAEQDKKDDGEKHDVCWIEI